MRITRGRGRIAAGLMAAGLAVLVGIAGCTNGGDDGGAGTDSAAGFSGNAGEPAAEPLAGGDAGAGADLDAQKRQEAAGAPAQDQAQQPNKVPGRFVAEERSIIYTGSITVRARGDDTVEQLAERAVAAATGAGGFVGSDGRTSDNGHSQATIELRIPADRFKQVVDQLAKLGKEESRKLGTEDVTEQVVDLDARIATQQASVSRTRALLAQARTVAEIVSVEGELAKREAELASLQGKKRRLDDLTALSTITLVLLGPEAPAPKEEESDSGFFAGLKAGWKAFVTSMEVLLTVLGAVLPWLLALGVPIYGAFRLYRWWTERRRRAAPPGAEPAVELQR